MSKKKSPAKELRDLKRSISFIRRKNINSKPLMTICPQQSFSIPPANGPKLSVVNLSSVSVSPIVLRKPKLELSRISYVEISPNPNLPNSVPAEQVYAQPIHTHEHNRTRNCLPKFPLDVRDYTQHDLNDEDPDIREKKRQENVKTTLWMIDEALQYSR